MKVAIVVLVLVGLFIGGFLIGRWEENDSDSSRHTKTSEK